MLQHTSPPRNRVVHIRQPDFKGQRVHVATLPQTAPPQMLRRLISGDQLAVSPCGLFAGQALTHTRTTEVITHSEFGLLDPTFLRFESRQWEGVRIIEVGARHVLAWGKVDNHPPGVWLLAPGESRFLYRIDRLVREGKGAIKGINADKPGEGLYLTPWGSWPVAQEAHVVRDSGGLCVIETLAGYQHIYRVSEAGVSPFALLTLNSGERAASVAWWRDHLILAVVRGSQSWLIQVDRAGEQERRVRLPIDGDLRWLWASPAGRELVMLIHPRGAPEDVFRIQLADGRVVYEGRFVMDSASLTWSPRENHMIVRVRDREGSRLGGGERIVGTRINQRVPPGLHIREMLVDDRGSLAAVIEHDGLYDQPVIGGRAGTKVPLAWNLHYDQEGRVAWTTVHDDCVFTWKQELPTTIGVVGHAMR